MHPACGPTLKRARSMSSPHFSLKPQKSISHYYLQSPLLTISICPVPPTTPASISLQLKTSKVNQSLLPSIPSPHHLHLPRSPTTPASISLQLKTSKVNQSLLPSIPSPHHLHLSRSPTTPAPIRQPHPLTTCRLIY